jgi:hypothetical protein
MNLPTDTVEDNEPQVEQDAPNSGAESHDRETSGDTAGKRSPGEANKAQRKDDDLIAESDPLVRARKGAFDDKKKPKPVEPPAPAGQDDDADQGQASDERNAEEEEPPQDGEPPTAGDEPAEEERDEAPKPKPAEKKSPADAKLLDADLPQEDWSKLTHKGKSLFLGVRKIAKAATAEATKARQEAEEARGNYEAVDGFVRSNGLGGDEFRNGVITLGLAKRGDPRVIPALEKTLDDLRRINGVQAPKPAAPPIDADELEKEIAAAEASFDFDKLKGIAKKLKDSKAATPAPTPTQQPIPQQQQSHGGPAAQQPSMDAERVAMGNIAAYLVGEGIAPDRIEAHVVGLLKKYPGLRTASIDQRFAEFQKVFKAERSKATQPRTTQTRQPLSGRTSGSGGRGGQSSTQPSADPLVLARQGRLRP